jgi:nitroreductase
MSDLTLFEAIDAQRALRRFKPDPVPRAAIDRMLEAAIRAPSRRNIQPWRSVVVRDDALRRTLAHWYPGRGSWDPAAPSIEDDLAMAPILIVVCFQHTDRDAPPIILGASVYPAVQKLMLAATELGLGTTITGSAVPAPWRHRQAPGLALPCRAAAVYPGRLSGRWGELQWQPTEAALGGSVLRRLGKSRAVVRRSLYLGAAERGPASRRVPVYASRARAG